MLKKETNARFIALALAAGLALATPAVAKPDKSTQAVEWTYQPASERAVEWTYNPGNTRQVEWTYQPAHTQVQPDQQYKSGYSSPGQAKGFNPQPEPPGAPQSGSPTR